MAIDLTDPTVETAAPAVLEIPTHEEIAERAFQLFERRGGTNGDEVQDWLAAERQLLLERKRAASEWR